MGPQRLILRFLGGIIALMICAADLHADELPIDWPSVRNQAFSAYYGGDPVRSITLLKSWIEHHTQRDETRLWALYNVNEQETFAGFARSETAQLIDTEDYPNPTLDTLAHEMSIHFRASGALVRRDGKEADAILRQSHLVAMANVKSLDVRALQRLLLLDFAGAAIVGHRGVEVQISLDAVIKSLLIDQEATPFERAELMSRVALIYDFLGDDDLALTIFDAIAPYWIKHLAVVSPTAMSFFWQYAIALQRAGRFEDARNVYGHMAKVMSRLPVTTPAFRATVLIFKAFAETSSGRAADAKETAQSAIEVAKPLNDDTTIAVATALLAEARLQLQDKDFLSDAPALLATMEKMNAADPGVQAYGKRIISMIAEAIGDHDEALRAIDSGADGLFGVEVENAGASFDLVRKLPVAHQRIIEQFVGMARSPGAGKYAIASLDDKLWLAIQLLNRDPVALGISAGAAIRQTDDPRLSDAIRSFEQLNRVRSSLRKQAISLLIDLDKGPVDQSVAAPLVQQMSKYLNDITPSFDAISATAPGYFITSRGALARLSDVKSVLKPDEALVTFGQAGRWLVAMCVRSDTAQWAATKEPGNGILDRNLNLRRILTDYSDEALLHFDVASARYLYDELLAPLAGCIGNRALIIAPAPDLLTVPFAALLTDEPPPGTTFKQWPWLIRRQSISIVPSPASFVYLRKNRRAPVKEAAFVGFGNPVFANASGPTGVTRNAMLYRGANSAEIRSLPPLPDTEDELKAVVKVFGPDHSRLFLGRSATKKALHAIKLEDYRFIEFATHGLVAGDFTQLLEPAIALTPEDTSDPENDGLLTSSEIRTLILKADLVVLSACNTAAPDGAPNAKGLSGLANAFFEAGAHSLLVSQWSVYSSAAAAIIPETLRNLERDQGAGSAEALRKAMLTFLDDARRPELAHPRAWAAFTVAGDGLPTTLQ